MPEEITFHFEGALSDQHLMNFYEAARFQYAAARLLVKLAQFRQTGRFAQKISAIGNQNILLKSQADGSFDINLIGPPKPPADDRFLNIKLSELLSYVSERLIAKTDDGSLISALNSNANIVSRFGVLSYDDPAQADFILQQAMLDNDLRLSLMQQPAESVETRLAEISREQTLDSQSTQIARIDSAREQKLVSMAAPLVSEMATALRRSATTLHVYSGERGNRSRVMYLNRRIAQEIETAKVDKEITPIIGNIIQYNKENGWGKVRLAISVQPLSFNIPSDIKPRLQSALLSLMERDEVYLQLYIVRDRANEPTRVILVGILPPPR